MNNSKLTRDINTVKLFIKPHQHFNRKQLTVLLT